MTVTVALATTKPCWSVIVPVTPPRLLCATINTDESDRQKATTVRPNLPRFNLNIRFTPFGVLAGCKSGFCQSFYLVFEIFRLSKNTAERPRSNPSVRILRVPQSGLIKVFLWTRFRFAAQNGKKSESETATISKQGSYALESGFWRCLQLGKVASFITYCKMPPKHFWGRIANKKTGILPLITLITRPCSCPRG